MDTLIPSLIAGLFAPVYIALFIINRKIGKYDHVCEDVRTLEREVKALWQRVAEG